MPKSDRPREKLIAKGVDNLKDSELLAILLRTGTKGKNAIEIASQILSKYSKKRLLQMTYQDLAQITGIDSGKATALLAAFELSKRALEVNDTNLPTIETVKDAVAQLSDMRDLKKEHFVVLYLNAKNQLVHKETISMGTLNANLVHPREVFEPALKYSAAQIIAAHNHPSGDPILERWKKIEREPPHQTFWCGDKLVEMLKETESDFTPTPIFRIPN